MITAPRVVAIGSPPTIRQEVARALQTQPDAISWVAGTSEAQSLLGQPHEGARVIVVAHGVEEHKALELARSAARTAPTTALVLVRDHDPNGTLAEAMRAGFRDVVDISAGNEDLQEALERAIVWSSRLQPADAGAAATRLGHQGVLVSVFSSKGGTGKTFLSCNLAAALSDMSQKDTSIVDVDLGFGDVFAYYGAQPGAPLADIAALGEAPSADALHELGTPLGDHLWGFGGPPDPTVAPVPGSGISSMLQGMRRSFPFTLIDAPADYSDAALAAMDASDAVCLITAPDVVSARHLVKGLETLISIGLPRERFRIVLNRADSDVGISAREIERVMRIKVDALIPSSKLVPVSLNRGCPVVVSDPDSPVARGVRSLAEHLLKLAPEAPPRPDRDGRKRLRLKGR